MRKSRRKEEGQATVEFALTFLLLMGFCLFYARLALVFAFGNYVHYATFMSARAYLSAGPTEQDQIDRAKAVIVRTVKKSNAPGLDRFPSVAKGDGEGDPEGFIAQSDRSGSRNSSWLKGVRYRFRSRLVMIPFMKDKGQSAGQKSASKLTLTSESWLGREPTHEECKNQMGTTHALWDNGC